MFSSFTLLGLVAFATFGPSTSALSIRPSIHRRDEVPAFPHDPNTTPYCTWWWDNDGSIACADMPIEWSISLQDLLRWNPSITPSCTNFNVNNSYCVEGEPEPEPEPTTASPTSSPSPTTSTVTTPTPTRPGMVANCDAFYLVKDGDLCAPIAASHGISTADFLTWNPLVGSDCKGLWANSYVCVSVIGHTPSQPTPTDSGNGVTTPLPTQPGMVNNCDAFYLTKSGDSCDTIIAQHSISAAQFVAWNPKVGQTCTGLWADAYVCVSIIGHTPSQPTPTDSGNGVTTPLPTQPGMVNNCDAFYLTKSGDSCDTIIAQHSISAAQFLTWNPTVGQTCTGLWADAYVCVSIIGHTPSKPTSTSTGPSPTTTVIDGTSFPLPPLPTQSGTLAKCNRWHRVVSGNSCVSIANQYGIALTQLNFWNKGININCSNLWLDTSLCVASGELASYWSPIGCYSDNRSSRALANKIDIPNEANIMSPKVCHDACRAAGYRYAGLEFGSQCWCDNSIKNGHTSGNSGCTMPCPGKPSSHVCGGSDRINIYRLDKYNDLGCFTDSRTSRSLQNQITGIGGMTRRICQLACEKSGYRFSGVEYGSQCFCDNANAGTLASSGCDMPCSGNAGEMCGGSDRINVMTHPTSRNVGCWSDNDAPNMRSLKYQQVIPNASTLMTPDLCRNTCRSLGFLFSGVEFGSQCFCDDKIHSGQATTGCNMPCPGNPSMMCGGGLRLNIYEN